MAETVSSSLQVNLAAVGRDGGGLEMDPDLRCNRDGVRRLRRDPPDRGLGFRCRPEPRQIMARLEHEVPPRYDVEAHATALQLQSDGRDVVPVAVLEHEKIWPGNGIGGGGGGGAPFQKEPPLPAPKGGRGKKNRGG